MKKQLLLPLLALIIASLACTMSLGGPEIPYEPISYDPNAAVQLQAEVAQAFTEAAVTGVVSIDVTEQQLTSVLISKLVPDAEGNPPILTNPQAYLRDGKMEIYGLAQQGNFTANVRIAITAGVTADGQPDLQVESVDFGPIPAPDGLNATIETMVREAFTGSLGPVATGFRMERITIANGVLTVQGRTK